jgi:homoserine kinase type II
MVSPIGLASISVHRMAVYTEVTDEELDAFVAAYDIGAVTSCKGIAEGIENSNYLLRTAGGTFILTLYERRVRPADLPYFLGLMDHLAADGVPCPTPVHGIDGQALRSLCGRPAAILTFLDGVWPRRPTPDHCAALGAALARMHLAADGFAMTRANDLSLAGWRQLFEACRARADEVLPGLAQELAAELDFLEACWPAALAAGVIHADLFPDNVFFLDGRLSGVIDFYFACNDSLAYDIAICLNAWCFDADVAFNVTAARRLLAGYGAVRPLTGAENAALPILARGAALRFVLTRLHDRLFPAEGALVRPKDPLDFLRRLRFHRAIEGPSAYGVS